MDELRSADHANTGCFGRNGVPFYVIYGTGEQSPAVTLPEIISPGIVKLGGPSMKYLSSWLLCYYCQRALHSLRKLAPLRQALREQVAPHKRISLGQYHRQYVVLQWHNKDCPYVTGPLRLGEYAEAPERMDCQRDHLVDDHFVSGGQTRLCRWQGCGGGVCVRNTSAVPTATILDPAEPIVPKPHLICSSSIRRAP